MQHANHASLHPLVLHSTKIQLERKTKILQMLLYEYGRRQKAYTLSSKERTKSGTTSGKEMRAACNRSYVLAKRAVCVNQITSKT